MENTIIKKEDIENVADRLGKVIAERKDEISSVTISIKFAEEIIADFNKFIHKTHKQIKEGEKEIYNIERMQKKLRRLEFIDTNSATFDEDVLPYVEGESLICTYEQGLSKGPFDLVREDMQGIVEKINAYIKEGRQEQDREEEKSLEEEKLGTKILDQSKKDNGVQIKVNNMEGTIANITVNPKNEEDYVAELIMAKKMCEQCHNFTEYALIMNCQCAICINCLKENFSKENEQQLSNTFEAQKKKYISMYTCPTHKTPISTKFIEEICGEDLVEKASIEAMRRQLQECILSKTYYPNLCMNCKNLINDDSSKYNVVTLCSKHKVCNSCHA